MPFLVGLVIGGSITALMMTLLQPTQPDGAVPKRPLSTPAAFQLPPEPQIHPVHNPSEVPAGPIVVPEGPGFLHELPGEPGYFSYEGISFRYPTAWEMVAIKGYFGLAGNHLWTVAIGIDNVDRVFIDAIYFPWDYSSRQMQTVAESVVEYLVTAHPDGRVLRPPSPVETAGVTVYWSDIVGRDPDGEQVLLRVYVFAWNDVQYYFGCQQGVRSQAEIIRGCDEVFSTLRLGMLTA